MYLGVQVQHIAVACTVMQQITEDLTVLEYCFSDFTIVPYRYIELVLYIWWFFVIVDDYGA